MESPRRTQAERSDATRDALVRAARPLFAARGYAAVGTPEIARAASVTRGGMYHQFPAKVDLFMAVAIAVEIDITQRLVAAVEAAHHTDPLEALTHAIDLWLDACQEQEIRQVLLIDAPTVLGWDRFRDLAADYGLGLTEQLVAAAIEAGRLRPLPPRTVAHLVLGALQEAAFLMAHEPEAREDVDVVIRALLDGLTISPNAA